MTIQLIVNADDYGYFPCVSRGIVEAAQSGALTATGILVNYPDLTTQLKWLDAVPQLDIGVHLNLTFKQPLTTVMRENLARWHGLFPNAYVMSLLIVTGKMSVAVVREEWCAQIEACKSKKLLFLNSHEHIHMLPILFSLVLDLAKSYNIPYVRMTRADWIQPFTGASLIRNTLMQTMQTLNQRHIKKPAPLFLGLGHSGRLNYEVLCRILSTLKEGQCYELMCHVGHFDSREILNPKQVLYHNWVEELDLFTSHKTQELFHRYNVELTHYHNL